MASSSAVSYTHLDVYKRQIRHLGHGVIAYAQALDEDFAVFIRFEGLVVAVGPGHAEGEALSLIHI